MRIRVSKESLVRCSQSRMAESEGVIRVGYSQAEFIVFLQDAIYLIRKTKGVDFIGACMRGHHHILFGMPLPACRNADASNALAAFPSGCRRLRPCLFGMRLSLIQTFLGLLTLNLHTGLMLCVTHIS